MKITTEQRRKLLKLAKRIVPVIAIVGYSLLTYQLSREKKELTTPTQAAFQESTSDWTSHPQDSSHFIKAVTAGQVDAVGVGTSSILYTTKDGKKFSSRVVCTNRTSCLGVENLGELSSKHNFKLVAVDIDTSTPVEKVFAGFKLLFGLVYTLGMLCLFYVIFKQAGVSFFADKPELAEQPETKFDDVIGAVEAKAALMRVRAFLTDAELYTSLGAKAPRGVLLEGGPGTGKTLLARALAGECGANFISVDGSYFSAMYYGAGVEKVKKLFQLAKDNAPCILFIDELDGMGRRTTGDMRGGEQELNRIINRILVEMDGFEKTEQVIVVGATNHAENIDPAMRRPGRFDMVVHVPMPTPAERKLTFDFYLTNVKTDSDINTDSLGRMAAGLSPADIANIVNKAVSSAAEQGSTSVNEGHLYMALETHQLGGEVNSNKSLLTPETKYRLALHESSHAVVAHLTKTGNVDRVSIEPRGQGLGATFVTRFTEEPLYGEKELYGRVAMTLAGREGELLVLGSVSSGSSDDLEKATQLAMTMVGNFGFSKAFGLLSVKGIPKELLGPDTQKELLLEARGILEKSQQLCVEMLARNRGVLLELTDYLLTHEKVSGKPLQDALAKLT